MIITIYGTRGSIPVSGKEYLKYGGDTTCIEIRTDNDQVIIIDAGTGIRKLGYKLLQEKKFDINLLITHFHWDHIQGFPYFKPIFNQKNRINIYSCDSEHKSAEEILSDSMKQPYFPVPFDQVEASIKTHHFADRTISIGDVKITPISLNHLGKGQGYKFEENGKVFVFITDNELGYSHSEEYDYEKYRKFIENADLFIHDAEFTEKEYSNTKGWGHSLYTDALKLAMDGNVKSFGLFHHNQDRDDKSIDLMVADCELILKKNNSNISCFAVYCGQEIKI